MTDRGIPSNIRQDNSRLLIIIPAYNEAENVGRVIDEIRASSPYADIVVINDCSMDATAAVAESKGVSVINLPFNLGIGGAMQTGYRFALEGGYDIAVQVDGDGQHDPSEISRLIEPVINGEADMVMGSRYIVATSYQTTWVRRLGMRIFSFAISSLIGQPVKDTTSGFRAANRRIIALFAREYPCDYPEVEALVLVHRARCTILEIPATLRARVHGQSSITPFRAVYYMVKVLLAALMSRVRVPLSSA